MYDIFFTNYLDDSGILKFCDNVSGLILNKTALTYNIDIECIKTR